MCTIEIITALLIGIMLTSCAPLVKGPAVEQDRTHLQKIEELKPAFEKTPCWFEAPKNSQVTCGYVSVPEDRQKILGGNNTIRLAVAIFHAQTSMPAPDPVIYQLGGPGGHMLGFIQSGDIFNRVIKPYLKWRDLVFFDPRGTGLSQPALECNEGEDPRECLNRLFAEGHNLYMYNSSSMAEDLQDIRNALGYDEWNLVGESYGSHVAQVAMREYPDGLRSVILDAVVPIQLPDLPGDQSTFELSLSRLVEHCAEDNECNTAYPLLKEAIGTAVHRLNRQPASLSFDLDGTKRSSLLTGDILANQLMTALYEAEAIPYLPSAIYAAANGSSYEFWDFTQKWELNLGKILSSGAHWAVQCGDGRIDYCENWPLAIEQRAVESSLPTLVVNGEFDPVTPPEYGYEVARWLTKSYVVDFPGFGHWADGTGYSCPEEIIQSFLDDPEHAPNTSCIEELNEIDFYIPGENSVGQ